MRFPRHARIFRGQLDAAPFAGVFFLVLIFITFNSQLVFTPGVRVDLPQSAAALAGTANPTVPVVVDASGQLYYKNQIIAEPELKQQLRIAADRAKAHGLHLTLVILADKLTPNGVTFRLGEIAREAGIQELLHATKSPAPPVRVNPKP